MYDALGRLSRRQKNLEKKVKELTDDSEAGEACGAGSQEGFMYRRRKLDEFGHFVGFEYLYIPAEECSSSSGDTPNQQAPPSTT